MKLLPKLSALACTIAIAGSAYAENVELTLIDNLDGVTSSYCIDVKGGNQNVDITKGLQAHTCYSYKGALGADQIFDTTRFADNMLYMSELDVCVQLESLEAGASIGLAACDGNSLQLIAFGEDGSLRAIGAPEMCLTVGADTSFGRSKVHQIKTLSLQSCSEELSAYQLFRGRVAAD